MKHHLLLYSLNVFFFFQNRQIYPPEGFIVSTHKLPTRSPPPLSPPLQPRSLLIKTRPPRPSKLRPPLTGYSTYRIHLINGCISFHSCQISSPAETGFFIVSAHRLTNITLLTLIATL